MYAEITAAVCRPGFGVLTDLLTVGARPFVIHESTNAEMQHNARVLIEHGIGQLLDDDQWLDQIKEYASNPIAQRAHRQRCQRLSTQKPQEAAELILHSVDSSQYLNFRLANVLHSCP